LSVLLYLSQLFDIFSHFCVRSFSTSSAYDRPECSAVTIKGDKCLLEQKEETGFSHKIFGN